MVVSFCVACACGQFLPVAGEGGSKRDEILIGIEYAMPGEAKAFGGLGISAVKHYPDAVAWGKMQTGPSAAIDFSKLDQFVREYQQAGFTDLVIALKSQSNWASISSATNFVPKPEYLGLYENWIRSIVERYDKDGADDMPGLKRPVRFFEVGTEFSTYEPEPASEYVTMLQHAYQAAHLASDQVVVLHAAFLTTTAFKDHPTTDQYEAAFAAVDPRIMYHSLADIRAVLDRFDLFDAVNVHSVGDPIEIEDMIAWLRFEMSQRSFSKPVFISDTTPTPFIAWGPATRATGDPSTLGIVIPPAVEADRTRLASFFTQLVSGDAATIAWTHSFVAQDMVKKVVIAAEQQVKLIDTSFAEDLFLLQNPLLQAGAGTSAWAGMADVTINIFTDMRTVNGLRPSFYAIQQLQDRLKNYDSVVRVANANPQVRLYEFTRKKKHFWVAWLEPSGVVLLGDTIPTATLPLSTQSKKIKVEKVIAEAGQTVPERESIVVTNGEVQISLTPLPVYVTEGN